MKTAPLLFSLCLLLQSCSTGPAQISPRSPAQYSVALSCSEILRSLPEVSPSIWHQLTDDPQLIYKYNRDFRYLDLTDAEKNWLVGQIKEIPDDDDFRRKLRSAILYARTLSGRQNLDFYAHLTPWVKSDQAEESAVMARFLRHYNRVIRFEQQIYDKELKKLAYEPPAVRIQRSRKVAFEKARLYERNYYRCMNAVADPSQVTAEGLRRANTVALGITFGGAASALVTYAATNYDLEKDKDWWTEIAFVIVTSMAMGYVNSKWILANPRLSLWTQRFPLVMAATAAQDVGVTALWNQLLGTEPPGHEEVKRLLADEKFQEKLAAFMEWLEGHPTFEEHFARMSEFLEGVDPDELDVERTLDLFVQALSDYDYESSRGRMSLGSEDYDRYAFHRGMDLIYQPAFIIASQLMYNSMCVNANPKVGMLKAIGLFMAINIATDGLYFVGRRGLINQ